MKHLQGLKTVERMPNLIVEDVRDICVFVYSHIYKGFYAYCTCTGDIGFSPFY
jgi:hypothetical protein